ncbi:MAG TPA: hypothetical protein VND21_00395, partial [Planctomycetota bacterium]|nr:hypothetical protein [Planctomycetota bacterium]
MRPRLAVPGLLLALLAPSALAAPPRDPMDAARALDDPSWEERRRAEADLLEMGLDALATTDAATDERLAAWDAALAAAERGGGPGPSEAVARVLRRLERDVDDAGIRRAPRLLRARLARLVPFLVTDDMAEAPVGFSRRDRTERR